MSKRTNDRITKEDYENKDFLIRLNYVETSEPDKVAKELQIKDQRIAELEKINKELASEISRVTQSAYNYSKELAELKQKLEKVEPKFKHKEWCWTIQDGKIWNINVHLETNTEHIYTFVYDGRKVIDEDGFEEIDTEMGIEWGDKNLFKTKEEAQQKLKELEGK